VSAADAARRPDPPIVGAHPGARTTAHDRDDAFRLRGRAFARRVA